MLIQGNLSLSEFRRSLLTGIVSDIILLKGKLRTRPIGSEDCPGPARQGPAFPLP